MKKVIVSSKFDRAFRRYVRRHPERKGKIQSAIQQLESDVFAQSLGTHPLKGKLDSLQSCSCGCDCRIVFSIESEEIILIDIGTHDEVY